MKFLSVCSGIEAASVAWQPLGWKAVAFSEIEPFPCNVLAHHYPDTPNWGDMTKYKDWPDVSIDLLCGGTPCQSFSVAGLRKGLDDPRGNLMLTFGAIAAKYRPKWLVWENVPGVLSSNGGADFGAFLGMLGELGYGFAYRVFDAQYFGVAQRRRRVFIVGCLGDWRSAAAVLFERHSMQGHPAPSRQAGKGFAADTAPCLTGSGRGVERPGETRGQDPVIAVATLCVATGQAGAEIGADMAPTLNCNHESPYVAAYGIRTANTSSNGWGIQEEATHTLDGAMGIAVAHSLRGEGFDASEDGTGRGTPLVPVIAGAICKESFSGGAGGRPEGAVAGHFLPVAFPVSVALRGRDGGATAELGDDLAFALRASSGGGDKPHVLAFDTTQMTSAANRSNPKVGDPCHPLAAGAHAPGIAFSTKLHNTTSNQAGKVYEEYTVGLDRNSPPPALLTAMQVRRLTPVECARLQGFPDHYLDIAGRGKPAADGPKYKALGNSWAVPNVRWIGQRIDAVTAIKNEELRTA